MISLRSVKSERESFGKPDEPLPVNMLRELKSPPRVFQEGSDGVEEDREGS
jgi:hypothetical protein